jgi:signal transduction histidine kinase
MCDEAGADIVFVLESTDDAGGANIVASYDGDGGNTFLPNEPVWIVSALPHNLVALPELRIRSELRARHVLCGSSLVVPWRHRTTHGWLVVANVEQREQQLSLPYRRAREFGRALRQTYSDSLMRARSNIELELARAMRAVAQTEADAESMDDLLEGVLNVGRDLLKTSAFYLSLPDAASEVFTFSKYVGLRTNAFKRLRMASGQGLGGVTRNEREVVRSLDYARDFHDRDAPVHETVREGFVSAMCAPLIVEGQISGLLYAANRHLTTFSADDASLLGEFAGNVSLLFKKRELERLRQSAVRRNERNRIAHELHNSAVRKLMEIGYRAQIARTEGGAAHSHMSAIEEAAEACLTMLRRSVGELSSEWEGPETPSARDVIHALKSQKPAALRRMFELDANGAARLPLPVASGIVRIGLEALHNAECHSGGKTVTVKLSVGEDQVRLVVEDDGCGAEPDRILEMLNSSEHLGLRQIRSITAANNGSCQVLRGTTGGLRLDVIMPLRIQN